MDWVSAIGAGATVVTLAVVLWEAYVRRRDSPDSFIHVDIVGDFAATDGSASGYRMRIVNHGDRAAVVPGGIHVFGATLYLVDRPQLPSVLAPKVEHEIWLTDVDWDSAYVRVAELFRKPRPGARIGWHPLLNNSTVGKEYDAQLTQLATLSRWRYRVWAARSAVGPDGVPVRFLRTTRAERSQGLEIALGEVPAPAPYSRWSLRWTRDVFRAVFRRQ